MWILRIPYNVAAIYMGAINVRYPTYLLGSLLGILPRMLTYPIMGMNLSNVRSPAFIISLCAEIAYIAVTVTIYAVYRKKQKKG